mmetsp:Transcript_5000/g.14819  ORF Transcript_5000/g.14819 Transcript_5000/m.14819 type:complete len:379 (-) Transcript_5000:61-1197(-)
MEVFASPPDWAPMRDDGDEPDMEWWERTHIVPCPDDAAMVMVRTSLRRTVPAARIVSMERVQKRGLWRAYARYRSEQCRAPENELFLWHGTGALPPAEVLGHPSGLDPRFGSQGFYGRAIYLAEDAAYPLGGRYAHRVSGTDGRRLQLFLVRLCAGVPQDLGLTVTAETKKMLLPGKRPDGPLYDCVRAGPHRPFLAGPGESAVDASMVYCAYFSQQMYPEFIVTLEIGDAAGPLGNPERVLAAVRGPVRKKQAVGSGSRPSTSPAARGGLVSPAPAAASDPAAAPGATPARARIRLHLQNSFTGKTATMSVLPSTTIGEITAALERSRARGSRARGNSGLPAAKLRLEIAGVVLEDSDTLAAKGITDGATVQIGVWN